MGHANCKHRSRRVPTLTKQQLHSRGQSNPKLLAIHPTVEIPKRRGNQRHPCHPPLHSIFQLDLIIFPESALEASVSTAVEIRDMEDIPCGWVLYPDFMSNLSCAAAEAQTFMVVNLVEKVKCNESDQSPNCKTHGFKFYNCDLVLNRAGAIVERSVNQTVSRISSTGVSGTASTTSSASTTRTSPRRRTRWSWRPTSGSSWGFSLVSTFCSRVRLRTWRRKVSMGSFSPPCGSRSCLF